MFHQGPYRQLSAKYSDLFFATHLEYSSPMEPVYFEISFSKGSAERGEYCTVYVQLNLEDKTLLQLGGSVELRTKSDCDEPEFCISCRLG